ncbi:MAG: hypothetical protein ABJL17_06860 [Parvibaculum sp.]|uniref:hypothetical protein n=1 Tax=Parvibaculum sp. TaxID=2024848 RepID=UPI0032671ACD
MEERIRRKYWYRRPDHDGIISRVEWSLDGKFDWTDGPALVETDDQGERLLEEWYFSGKLSRDDGPARIVRFASMVTEEWYSYGRLRRFGGPARTIFNEQTEVYELEEWVIDDLRHRMDGPALIHREEDGQVTHEAHYREGVLHRTDGPTIISTDPETGVVVAEEWYEEGVFIEDRSVYRDPATGQQVSKTAPPGSGSPPEPS